MNAVFRYYRKVDVPVLQKKKFFGITYHAEIRIDTEYQVVAIALGDEASLLKTLFQQPKDSKSRRLLKALLGPESYGFQIEDENGAVTVVGD